MRIKLVILFTLIASLAFTTDFGGTTSETDFIYLKTLNGGRVNSYATGSFNYTASKNAFNNQFLQFKVSKATSNKYSIFQYNLSIYQGLFEQDFINTDQGSNNNLYDYAGVNGSLIGALKFRISRLELCYGVSFGAIYESGDVVDFNQESEGFDSENYEFYSASYGGCFYHLTDDSYFSMQSASNSNYLNTTSFIYQSKDVGFWYSIGYSEYEEYFGEFIETIFFNSVGISITF